MHRPSRRGYCGDGVALYGVSPRRHSSPVLTISAVIDNTYVAQVGEAAARMRVDTILNNVVIIYRDQVPLQAIVTSVEIRAVRGDNRAIEKNRKRPKKDNSAVTLFFTDKELTIGSTEVYGYANIGSLCTRDAIAVISLTTDEIDLMVIAHEMAHIFGVPHDGVDECETTPPTGFLMQAVGSMGRRSLNAAWTSCARLFEMLHV